MPVAASAAAPSGYWWSNPVVAETWDGYLNDINGFDVRPEHAWTVTGRVQVRAGVSNVFDKDPPLVPVEVCSQAGALNTFPTYDILGRSIFMALRVTF
jgi:outer membrane receptor for ferrienterochelin and colicin